MPSATEWAYLAGLIDGEGCIHISHRSQYSNSYEYYVAIWNTDKPLIEHLNRVFGGKAHYNERNDRQNKVLRFGSKPIHRVIWHSKTDIPYILNGVRPYLLVKVDKADNLLDFLNTEVSNLDYRYFCYELAANQKRRA
jgi:hypothetical protein